MVNLTELQLKKIIPYASSKNIKIYTSEFNKVLPLFNIDTSLRVCHFLAQVAHESDSFNAMEEYASGTAYEGRKDLGNTYKGDGVKFKGRGPIQVTGRANYSLMGIKAAFPLKFINDPKLLSTYEWGVWAACIFWTEKGLLDISNMPDTARIPYKIKEGDKYVQVSLEPVVYITRRVNGGIRGLSERIEFYQKSKDIIK